MKTFQKPVTCYISGKPSIRVKNIFIKVKRTPDIFPLNEERTLFFYSGRYALHAGTQALNIRPGDAVLLPSYNCGVEIDPFIALGVKVIFYKINKNLLIDFNDLKEKINSNVKAVLVTHFLGFPQPIKEVKKICAQNNIYLIEDCAHGFLSNSNGKALGSDGDISIFSLLKTLSVLNGGVLLINNQDINCRQNHEDPNSFSTFYYAVDLLKNRTSLDDNSYRERIAQLAYGGLFNLLSTIRILLAGFRKYLHANGLYLVRPDSYIFNEKICSWRMSAISQAILSQTDFKRVKQIRRQNFEHLLQYFLKNERGDLPFRELPRGVCPLFFPIILKSPAQRENLYQSLRERGVVSHPWWKKFHPAVPWDDFPDAVFLKQRLFGLPIHQDLTLEHMGRIIEEFEKAYKAA